MTGEELIALCAAGERNFAWANLNRANLNGANLNRASLDGASLDGASLNGANLNGASLDGASLYGASLDGASLYGASLDGASLYGASLNGANLNRASLDGASLYGASLNGANLNRALFTPGLILAGRAHRGDYEYFAWWTPFGPIIQAGCCTWLSLPDARGHYRNHPRAAESLPLLDYLEGCLDRVTARVISEGAK